MAGGNAMTGEQPFEMSGHDNGQFAYSAAPHCPECTRVTDPTAIDRNLRIERPHKWSRDLSYTYDGAAIATERFVSVFGDLPGVRFVPLSAQSDHHLLVVDTVVEFDLAKARSIGPVCSTCDHPTHIIGGNGADMSHAPTGLSRTNLGFGDTENYGPNHPYHLAPRLFVGAELGRSILETQSVHVVLNPWPGPER
jgi:hypothetical protein